MTGQDRIAGGDATTIIFSESPERHHAPNREFLLWAALGMARDFIAGELEARRAGGIEDHEDYIRRLAELLEAIDAELNREGK